MASLIASVLVVLTASAANALPIPFPFPFPFPKGGGGRPGGGGGSTSTTTSSTTTSSRPGGYYSSGGYSSRGGGVGGGSLAGIMIGCAVALIAITIIIVYCSKQSKVSSGPVVVAKGQKGYQPMTTVTTTQTTTVIHPGEYPKPGSFLNSFNNASEAEFEAAAQFQRLYPPSTLKSVSPRDVAEVNRVGPQEAWLLEFEAGSGVNGAIEANINGGGGQIVTFSTPSKTVSLLSRLPLAIDPYTPGRSWFYFEVTVQEITIVPNPTVISIGLATKPYPPFRHIGWNKHSVGYHSDDGRAFQDDPFGGRLFAASFTRGDTVGCGYDPARGAVFYTLNGTHLGDGSLGPTFCDYRIAVAADGPCQLYVNVGGRAFMYAAANVGCIRPDRINQGPPGAYAAPPVYPESQ
ncbi:hypothetical protein HDU67_001945 [Dinochytrium kinnereticum]|nr:hypothetical protein HDU67_001945 [Dinochytrium kinnereticum]